MQETTNEFLRAEGVPCGQTVSGFTAESHGLSVEGVDPLVGDGYTKDVAGEVEQRILASSDPLHVRHPGFTPDSSGYEVIQACFAKGQLRTFAKPPGETIAGQDVGSLARFDPGFAGKATNWEEHVNVRVKDERLGPGLQHRHDSDQAADEHAVGGEFEQSVCRLPHEDRVDRSLMRSGNLAQPSRQSAGGKAVLAWKEKIALTNQPQLRLVPLALRAMTIATGVVDRVLMTTALTEKQLTTQSGGAAVDHVTQHPSMGRQQAIAELLHVGRSGIAKDVRELDQLETVSATACQCRPFHQSVDRVLGGGPNVAGQVGVDLGGPGTGVAEERLDQAKIDTVFEQVGGVAVAQGVHVSLLVNTGRITSTAERRLQARTVNRAGVGGDAVLHPLARGRREEPYWRSMGTPEFAQHMQSPYRNRHIAISPSLAGDVQLHAVGVDARNRQSRAFLQAQAAGVDRRQTCLVHRYRDRFQDPPHLSTAQHDGKFLVVLWAGDVEDGPLAAEGSLIEELQATQVDRKGPAGDLLAVQAQKVGPQIFLRNFRQQRDTADLHEPSHGAGVCLHRAFGLPRQTKIRCQSVKELFVALHGALLLGRVLIFGVPALLKECASYSTYANGSAINIRIPPSFRRRRIAFNKPMQRTGFAGR